MIMEKRISENNPFFYGIEREVKKDGQSMTKAVTFFLTIVIGGLLVVWIF